VDLDVGAGKIGRDMYLPTGRWVKPASGSATGGKKKEC